MHYGEILYKANRLNLGLCTDGFLISLFCGGKILFFQPHDPTAGQLTLQIHRVGIFGNDLAGIKIGDFAQRGREFDLLTEIIAAMHQHDIAVGAHQSADIRITVQADRIADFSDGF